MLVRIVGLGPGDPTLLTLGSLDALRAAARVTTVLAPPDLTKFLQDAGIVVTRDVVGDASLFVRGSNEEIERFVARIEATRADGVLALAVLGNPLSDV
ncbi:MAG: SAM-dependent methyltransferase, partial [Candidatus Eremiobacteraeota bacterium]|nr:SAM-dependent methyltransferase [Candidatus Eremiobacteraeota bacterium]